ncbi:MAG TPA: hypothetical protein VHT03_06355 [Rhizomicrobium sp.]|jgi:hypothetical protein|nr:hypothetical protein [Rhizomicrobium sp.]
MSKTTAPNGRCTICRHAERSRIEMLMVAGASKRSIAERFHVGQDAAWRHFTNHVSPAVKAATAAKALKPGVELEALLTEESTGLLHHLQNIRQKLYVAFDNAVEAGDRNAISLLAGRLMENLRFLSELTGRLQKYAAPHSVTNINILASPQFLGLQARLVQTLAPYPEARRAVIAAFREIDEAAPIPAPSLALPAPIADRSNAAA